VKTSTIKLGNNSLMDVPEGAVQKLSTSEDAISI